MEVVINQMNILIFTQNYPRSYDEAIISGMVKNPFYLSLALKKAGHNITVITSGDKRGAWSFEGVNAYCIGRGISKGVIHALIMEFKMFLKFLSLRKKIPFDIIHIHHINLLPLLFLQKIRLIHCPIVYTAHGTSTPEMNASFSGFSLYKCLLYMNGKIQHCIDSFCWRHADAIISPSRFQIKEMKELYDIPEEKITCIYNGVDNNHYFPDEESGKKLRHDLGISENSPVVLYVGRIARKKGIHFLINNAKDILIKLPEVKFVLVMGNMKRQLDYKKDVLQLVKSEGLESFVVIKENVPERKLPCYYNSSNICVFPSTGYESIPTVIYEAMACGKPIITQGSWGIIEVLENVLLTESEISSSVLGQNIVEILKNTELREKLHREELDKIKSFYWGEIAQQHNIFYQKLINKFK